MWKTVEVNRQTRFMKYVREEESHKVYFSDIVNVWMEELTLLSLSKRCKEMNSLVEAEPEVLAKHVYSLIVDGEKEETVISSTDHEERKELNIESQLAGIPFNIVFRMKKVDAEMVCKEVTIPLILLAHKQQAQLAQLQNMLIKKDDEIEQYKLEGAVLKKRKLETKPFNESILQEINIKSLQSDDVTESLHLFAKLCSQLPSVETKSSLSHIEAIPPEPEEQSDTNSPARPTTESVSAVKLEPVPRVKSDVKRKIASSKKPKLRI